MNKESIELKTMISKLVKETLLNDGITKSGNKFNFDWSSDTPSDIVPLKLRKYRGRTLVGNGTKYSYYHAYEMDKSEHSTELMKSMKVLDNSIDPNDVNQFINKAVIGFDNVFGLNTFDTIVAPESSSLILTKFITQLHNKSGATNLFSMAFVKNASTEITLDHEKVDKLPTKTYKSVMAAFKKATLPNTPFKIKEVFSQYRKFFHNFIIFNNANDRKLFNAVEGKRVILVDDYKTSGTTIKEMLQQLSDAGATEVVVIVLIKLK